MPDRLTHLLLKLYPEEFRERFGPQIEADLHHPDSNRLFALADIAASALIYRFKSPGPYVWLVAAAAACAVIAAAPLAVPRLPEVKSDEAVYELMFLAVFFVVMATAILAVHWLRCSKSKI